MTPALNAYRADSRPDCPLPPDFETGVVGTAAGFYVAFRLPHTIFVVDVVGDRPPWSPELVEAVTEWVLRDR